MSDNTRYPLLLLPGMMCNERLWTGQIQELGHDRDVLVADFTQDNTICALAARAFKSAPEEFILIGLSMGGIVAFEMWRQQPDRIKGMGLMSTNAFEESEARRQNRLGQIKAVHAGHFMDVVVRELKPNYVTDAHKEDAVLMEELVLMAKEVGPEVFEQQSQALMSRTDSLETLATITCPTRVLCGEEDELCPVEFHEFIASAIPGASLQILKKCAHLVSMEAANETTHEIQKLIHDVEKQEPK